MSVPPKSKLLITVSSKVSSDSPQVPAEPQEIRVGVYADSCRSFISGWGWAGSSQRLRKKKKVPWASHLAPKLPLAGITSTL